MRLLINAIPLLGEESGIGNYTRQIAQTALNDPDQYDLTFFYGYHSRKLRKPPQNGYGSWLTSLKGFARKGSIPRRICKKALYLANSAANFINPKTWDCYFEPNFVLLPSLRARTTAITVHDFSCFRYPQWHPAERVRYMEKFFWQSVEKADHIITVSQTIRNEAAAMYGISPERITAIPNGVDHSVYYPRPQSELQAIRKRYGLPDSFVLYVGTLEPRKNIANLVLAHAKLPRTLREHCPLLIIGSHGWNNEDALELIRTHASHARLLGYVPHEDLPAFYSASTLFAYPSWYEGFGLPVLEAMACGRAILTSNATALTELCSGAARHAPPADVDAIAANMRELLEDETLRSSLEKASITRAAAFDWQESAQAHLRIFTRLAS